MMNNCENSYKEESTRNNIFSGVGLVSDIPPCANYSGGIFIDQILRSIQYSVRHAFVVLNKFIDPVMPLEAKDSIKITTVNKPNEVHYIEMETLDDIRRAEISAAQFVEETLVPELIKWIKQTGVTSLWVLLEGQTMIRFAYEILQAVPIPMTVQVMDPPRHWLQSHNVDPETTKEVLDQYDYVLRHASACAAASWEMARIYRERYGVNAVAVVPSLPLDMAHPPASCYGKKSTFKIGFAGQIYAQKEWNVLLEALDRTAWTIEERAVEIHVFTQKATTEHLASKGVLFRGWLPTLELLSALQEMDLVYCPYRFGEEFLEESTLCFPSKLSTYLASGKPVLFHGPEYSSPSKFLSQKKAAFFCHSLDATAVESALLCALCNPKEYQRVAAAGRQLFDDFLSYRHLASALTSALLPSTTQAMMTLSSTEPRKGRPIILVIAFGNSVHTARWMNMVAESEFQFVLCPTYASPPSEDFDAVRLVRNAEDLNELAPGELAYFDLTSVDDEEVAQIDQDTGFKPFRPSWFPTSFLLARPGHVVAAIRRFNPIAIHSMEVQFAGYLTLAAKDYLGRAMPRWLLSNWGSDIFLYRKLSAHKDRLARVAQSIDGYLAECRRDVHIVRELGFQGQVAPTMPASGGINFTDFPPLNQFDLPSRRREIHVKGYHGWAGRGMHILSALHLAAPALSGFKIRVMLASPQMAEVIDVMRQCDGLDISCEPYLPTYMEAIRRLGQARISIGLGISDGISTTLLEAMAVGAFPIKGSTSCADEWIRDNTGFIVSPHDVRAMADALIRAATDDRLVDDAASINRRTVEERWSGSRNRKIFLSFLRSFIAGEEAASDVAAIVPDECCGISFESEQGARSSSGLVASASQSALLAHQMTSLVELVPLDTSSTTQYLTWPPAEPLMARHLIDEEWYCDTCPDLEASGLTAAEHYLGHGWREGRDPNPWFNTNDYLAAHPEVAQAGRCPLEHFISEGAAQGYRPHPEFDTAWYSRRYLDSEQPTAEALRHFLTVGLDAGAVPNLALDRPGIQERLLAVPQKERSSLLLRLRQERREEDRALMRLIDPAWYSTAYPEIAAGGVNPILHYLIFGWYEGRIPNATLDRPSVRNRLLVAPPEMRSALILQLADGNVDDDLFSGLIDADWYLATYPDVAAAGADPTVHYLGHGWREGRDPNPWFNTNGYLAAHPEVAQAGRCPLEHFISEGGAQGYRPHPEFDTAWYSRRYLDSAQPTAEALRHFLTVGIDAGAVPSPALDRPTPTLSRLCTVREIMKQGTSLEPRHLIDEEWYCDTYPDLEASGLTAAEHYLGHGWREGRDPNPWFNTNCYLAAHPEVAQAGRCPLEHFISEGGAQGYRPHPEFDTAWYSRRYLDSAQPTAEALRHFLTVGIDAGAVPSPALDRPGIQDWLLSTPPENREAAIQGLLDFLERIAQGPVDWSAADADYWPLWLARRRQDCSTVLVLCDAADPTAIEQAQVAARLLPWDEEAIYGMVYPDNKIVIGSDTVAVRFILPNSEVGLALLLQAVQCRRAATLSLGLYDTPAAGFVRSAQIPLGAEPK